MKSGALFLALYIATLAFQPCSDDVRCDTTDSAQVTAAFNQHEDADAGIDLCSPFCSCTCCRTNINQPTGFNFISNSPSLTDNIHGYKVMSVRFFVHAIWQPPRLM